MPKPEPKTVYLGARVPEKLAEAIDRAAEADRRTRSSWMRLALERAVEQAREARSASASRSSA